MNQKDVVLKKTREYVIEQLGDDGTGHDWWHIHRVVKNALYIGKHEGADLFICELAALLHDVADEKLNGSEEEGLIKVHTWLQDLELEQSEVDHIMNIIKHMSFKGGHSIKELETVEGKVVQDADRLDALGAIGIARTFTYSGAKQQLIYDPNIPIREHMSKQEYREGKSTAINHFYEKLLKLKDLMNTAKGRQMAEGRHQFMQGFLNQFYKEWEGKL